MQETKISWTTVTWNPTFGCSKVSDGCKHCYAETIALKFHHSAKPWSIPNAAENVQLKPHKLREPFALKEPSRIFVNSMSDLFHERIPDEYIARIFEVMNALPQHTFQVLTKRPQRAATWPGPWTTNIWMGTSVEDDRVYERLGHLLSCGAWVKWVSAEPLLGPWAPHMLGCIKHLAWVVVGGESGRHLAKPENKKRWMDHAWAREIRDACVAGSVPFFFKQSSGLRTEVGCALEEEDGSAWEWHQYPGDMRPPVCVRAAASAS